MRGYYQKYDIPTSISSKNLQKIINFYLLECPVPDRSFRGKTFSELGFNGRTAFGWLKQEMLHAADPSLRENYFPCQREALDATFQFVESVSPPHEYCVFLQTSEKTIMQSLYSAIRNAFAHGSFNVKQYGKINIYFLVNFKGYKKAQIVLQEKTLLAWISILQHGYSR